MSSHKKIIIPGIKNGEDIAKADISKIHSEINQLTNQRFTITTVTISFFAIVVGWFAIETMRDTNTSQKNTITTLDSITGTNLNSIIIKKYDSIAIIQSDSGLIAEKNSIVTKSARKDSCIQIDTIAITKFRNKIKPDNSNPNFIFFTCCLLFILLSLTYLYSYTLGKSKDTLSTYLEITGHSIWENNFQVFPDRADRTYIGYSMIQTVIFICLGIITYLYPLMPIRNFIVRNTRGLICHEIFFDLYLGIIIYLLYSRRGRYESTRKTWSRLIFEANILSEPIQESRPPFLKRAKRRLKRIISPNLLLRTTIWVAIIALSVYYATKLLLYK